MAASYPSTELAAGRCGQVPVDLVEQGANAEMNPESFRAAIGTIKDAANAESAEDVLDRKGKRHRFKQVTAKNWVTRFGPLGAGASADGSP